MAPADLILEAGKLLADPERWCQGALARDRRGTPVVPTSKRALKWDTAGAIYHAARTKPDDFDKPRLSDVGGALAALQSAAHILHRKGHIAVNDELGHAAVLECLRLAYRRTK